MLANVACCRKNGVRSRPGCAADRRSSQPTIVYDALVLPSLGYHDPAFKAKDGDLVVQAWHDEALHATGCRCTPRQSGGISLSRTAANSS
jgi:hypothetical protein